jgi:tetratricopeptide (TPR) repeat protein/outer membrane protein OmpA-like peptidoglycan-associated protein
MTLLLASTCLLSAYAQDYKKEEAKAYFTHQHYADALSVLKSADRLLRTDEEAQFLAAVCHYQLNQLEAADELLEDLIRNSRSPYPECWLYKGKIAHGMYQFANAADYYKGYLRRLKPNHPNRAMVWDAIRRCATGLRLQYRRVDAVVENLGKAVNTEGDEFAPVLSPNFSTKLYFSAIRPGNNGGMRDENGLPDNRFGQHYSDMFSCRSAAGGGSWQDVQPMHYLLNSPRHDVLFDFSADGSILYYFRGWKPDQGQIFVDTFRQIDQRTLSSDPFTGPVVASLGDGTPCLIGDTLILFASSRPGGYGGLDLYRTAYRNGQWTAPQNLGPQINSPYDETTPFLSRDGLTMYYSTNQPDLSLGGLDIVKAVFNPISKKWTLPELLPPPLNSPGDDAYFRIANDGFTAYFSSSRKDGYGMRDIYAAYFGTFLPEMELPTPPAYAYNPDKPKRKVQPGINIPTNDPAASPGTLIETDTRPETEPEASIPPPAPAEKARFSPLTFVSGKKELRPEHQEVLDLALEAMQQKPDLGLVLSSYGPTTGQQSGQDLYKSIQYAQMAAEYLVQKGINEDRFFLRASLDNGQRQEQLDLAFFTPTARPSNASLPTIGDTPTAFALPQNPLNQPLLYKVQVGSLKGAYNSSRLDTYPTPMVETTLDFPYYRYTLGAFATYAEAEAFRQKLLRGPFDSALVVAYIYGRRADRNLARQYLSDFADLAQYAN